MKDVPLWLVYLWGGGVFFILWNISDTLDSINYKLNDHQILNEQIRDWLIRTYNKRIKKE